MYMTHVHSDGKKYYSTFFIAKAIGLAHRDLRIFVRHREHPFMTEKFCVGGLPVYIFWMEEEGAKKIVESYQKNGSYRSLRVLGIVDGLLPFSGGY